MIEINIHLTVYYDQPLQDKRGKATRFRAHITMARHSERVIIPNLGEFSAPPDLHWNADEVHLIQSKLRPEGASYRVVERFALNAPTKNIINH